MTPPKTTKKLEKPHRGEVANPYEPNRKENAPPNPLEKNDKK